MTQATHPENMVDILVMCLPRKNSLTRYMSILDIIDQTIYDGGKETWK